MSGVKVVSEVAEAEFYRFIDAMDIDIDPKGMDDEDRKSLEQAKRTLVRAIEKGSLVVNDQGEFVFTPQDGDDAAPLTFHEPTGASYMAMDQKKTGHNVTKTFATMADMTRTDVKRFSKMANRDVKVCQAIAALFLG